MRPSVPEIFEQVVEAGAEEQQTLLKALCEGDADLRQEVEALLEADAALERGEDANLLRPLPRGGPLAILGVGSTLGNYRLVRELGKGGMGVVYLAERSDLEYRDVVAIKVVTRVSKDARRRMKMERQVLAELRHPNIATLYDGGTLEDERPYLVMEYVEGTRLDDYCQEQGLSVDERLKLFLKVCDAISFAHGRLIVHRDLKPSNILVTKDGEPKLVDFGIAKLLPGSSVAAHATAPGQQLMTPAYASPEQIDGRAITVRTDVYAAGLVLYELVTGTRPFAQEAYEDGHRLMREILDSSPDAPSVAAAHVENPQARQVGRDLDHIILKALRKEPEERYRSMAEMADDIRHYLDGMPIQARSDDMGYLLRAMARRYRRQIAATAVVLALLAGAFGLYVKQTVETARERDRADQAFAFMLDSFKVADPELLPSKEVTARQVMDNAAEKVHDHVTEPLAKAMLLTGMGEVYISLGDFDRAGPQLQEALDIRRVALGEEHLDSVQSLYQLAELAWFKREYGKAEELYRDVLALLPAQPSLPRARALRGLGLVLVDLDREEEAILALNEALGYLRADQFEPADREIVRCLEGLAKAAKSQGDYEVAESTLRDVVSSLRPAGPTPALGRSLAELGDVLFQRGQLNEARAHHEDALPILRESLGLDNPYVAEVLGKLVAVLGRLGDDAAAEAAIHKILSILPDDHPGTATALHNLTFILTNRGEFEEATRAGAKALRIQRKLYGEDHEHVAFSLCRLGVIGLDSNLAEAAHRRFEECTQVMESVHPKGHPSLAFPWIGVGRSLEALEGCESALPWFRKSYNLRRKSLGSRNFQTALVASRLGACLGKLGEDKEAERLLFESYDILTAQGLAEDDKRVRQAKDRIRAYHETRELKEKARAFPSPSNEQL